MGHPDHRHRGNLLVATQRACPHAECVHIGRRKRHADSGAAIIEFALAFPILMLLMLGIIDFGVNYSARVQTTNATRQASRVGSVGQPGTNSSCTLDPAAPLGTATKQLICLAKARTGVPASDVRVKVFYMDGLGRYTDDFSDPARLQNKYSIVVCVSTASRSVTGMLSSFFNGKFNHSRAVTKTGATPSWTLVNGQKAFNYIAPGAETPMTRNGVTDSWSWCTSDDPSNDH